MIDRERLEKLFHEHGDLNYKWINPEDVVVSQWVRFKCMFGCEVYGTKGSCPPNVPSITECREFFKEYEHAVVFHFQQQFDNPDERHNWSKKLNLKLIDVEREVFLAGYQKAFLLFMDECAICQECTAVREECEHKKLSRPCPESLGVDVFTTVRKLGLPIEVLTEKTQVMNRYSFLLIE
ncbi:DUF2284 domain-containing protein [bacterium]|nr:DUF2284 domain-containing protein [bacterium]MBU1881741.1 DUF2284 domain-containing protein [bacterium]